MSWQQLSRWLSAVAALIGALSFAGWVFSVPLFTRLSSRLVTMKVNTAVCLILAGAAVGILSRRNVTRSARAVATAFGVVILLVGLLTLLQIIFGWDFGIDQALVVESVESAGRSFPGRMGPMSAVIFICLGGAIITLDARARRGFHISQAFVLTAAALTFLIFLGYFYHVEFPAQLAKYFSIALHTVFAFTLLFAALLFARPGNGIVATFLADDPGGSLARRLLPSALLVPALVGWLSVQGLEFGFYGKGTPSALQAAFITFVFTGLVWTTAKEVQRSERRRKNTESRLAESERQLSDFFDHASVALHWVGPDGTIIRANDTELSMLGYAREEYVGKNIAGFHACPNVLQEMMRRLNDGETLQDYPARLIRRDGSLCEVLIHASVYRENGQFVHTRSFTRDVTDLNRTVRALRESEQRMRLAARTAGFGFHDYDVTGGLITWSEETYGMTGVPPDSPLSSDRIFRLLHPDDRARVIAEARAAMDSAGTGDFAQEFRIHREDTGERRWLLLRSGTIFQGDGDGRKAVRNTGIVTDITARKTAELQLRDSDDRYRAFIANSSEGIWRLEFEPPINTALPVEEQLDLAYQNGRLAECNDVMARMYGLPAAENLLGKTLDDMLPAADPQARAYLASIIQSGYRADDIESKERDVIGNVVYFSNSMVGVVEGGLLRRVWGTQRDTTERKAAQDAMRHSEENFRGIFTNAAVGMALMDLQGNWRRINDRVCAITGYSSEELLTRSFAEITHPDDVESDWENARRLLRGEITTYSMEKRFLHKEGTQIWINLTVSLLKDHEGNPLNFISVIEDITERKATAEALRESIEEATRSRLRAEAASRAKDDFLAALSHELRTPLNPVLMAAMEMAHDDRLPEEAREQITMICRNVTLEARLIDDLLDLTRIINGKLAVTYDVVDCHALLSHARGIIGAELDGRNLRLLFQLEATEHFVWADSTRLQQVFWNLLKNAVKFTPDGGTITVRTVNPESGRLLVSVIDTGKGIRAGDLGKIFLPFEQGAVKGRHAFGGLGLGLSISKALVELHDGRLEASSEGEGKGAVFTVELRAVAGTGESDPEKALPHEPSRTKEITLLFVEDDPVSLETAARLLKRRGYVVHPASSVKEALTLCEANAFDVVVTDIGLPDGTGIALMKEIRERYGAKGIALSGYGMDSDLAATAEAGFSGHLVKPINIRDLTALIDSVVGSVPASVTRPEA